MPATCPPPISPVVESPVVSNDRVQLETDRTIYYNKGIIYRVEGCTSTRKNPSLTLHQFPKESSVRGQWLMFCGCEDGANLFVCSLHFRTSDYENIFMKNARKKLQKDAVPTIRQPSKKSFSVTKSDSTQPDYLEQCQNKKKQSQNQFEFATMIPRVPQHPPADPKVRCRVCTKWGVKLVPFVDGGTDPSQTIRPQLPCSLPEAIASIGGVSVGTDDGLPQYCCVFCIRQIEPAYKLRQLCQESDRKLREMFPKEGGEQRVGQMVFVKVEEVFDVLGVEPAQVKEEPHEVVEVNEEPLQVPTVVPNLQQIELSADSYLAQADLAVPQQYQLTGRSYLAPTKLAVPQQYELSGGSCLAQAELTVEADSLQYEMTDEPDLDRAEGTAEADPQQYESSDTDYEIEEEPSFGMETEEPESDGSEDAVGVEETEIDGENEEDWYVKRPVTGIHCCGCKSAFKTKAQLLAHRDRQHIGRKKTPEQLLAIGCLRVQCEWCYKTLARDDLLKKHQERDAFEFCCKACGTSFNRRNNVVRHFRIMHKMDVTGPIICCGCAESFTTSKELATHSKTVHLPYRLPSNERKEYECNVCYMSFSQGYQLSQHRLSLTHEGQLYQCSKCKKCFKHLHKLRDHEQTHEKTRCSMCPATNSCPKTLQKHIASHKMTDGKFKCFQCGVCLISSEGLRSHSKFKHAGERPHACPHCTETFAREVELTVHVKSHLEKKSFNCTRCPATFFNTVSLYRHSAFVHKDYNTFVLNR